MPLPVAQYPLPASPETLGIMLSVISILVYVVAGLAVSWPLMTLAAETAGDLTARTSLRRLAVLLARRTPGAAVFSIALGIPAYFIMFVLHGEAMFPAALRMGWFWLGGLALLFVGVGSAFWVSMRRRGSEPSTLRPFLPDIVESYILAFRRRGLERPGLWLTALVSASFLAFGFLMTCFGVLVERPDLWGPSASAPDGLLLPLSDPRLFRRLVHILLGAVSIGGLAVAWHGADRLAEGEVSYGKSTLKFGAIFFAVPVALQAAAGPWLLMGEPAGVLDRMGGGHGMAGGLFLWTGASAALLAAVLVSLAPAARSPRPLVWISSVCMLYSVTVMVLIRQQVREIRLSDAGGAVSHAVSFHHASGAAAITVVIAGMAALAWMLAATTDFSGKSEDS
jgi:hypothetical protein